MTETLLKEFSAAAAANARPIYLIVLNDDGALANAPKNLQILGHANSFGGDAGSFLIGEEGVLFGVGDGSDPFVLAAAADKLPEGDYTLASAPSNDDAALAALAWLIGGYRFDRYKAAKPARAQLIAPEGVDVESVRRAAISVNLVRDLVNTPAEDMHPAALEAEARSLADAYGAKVFSIIGDDLLAQNFPLVHAVGRAAAVAPRLVDISWAKSGGRTDAPKITLVGKGVCFDSGGLNIKGGSGMGLMKKDMGGAAHCLGLARMIMDAGLDVRLRVILPCVENAISAGAFRPSDILKSRKGLSIEIGNTDAEGRLVLADAMALGAEDDPDFMVTLATLTGAARVALGPDLPPVYCDNDALASAVIDAAGAFNDPLWRMPLWKPYEAMLSSTVADVNHISSSAFAGSVTAALFLKKFAPENAPWMHFDIFAWRPKAAPGRPVGAECQAIRALYEVIASRFAA